MSADASHDGETPPAVAEASAGDDEGVVEPTTEAASGAPVDGTEEEDAAAVPTGAVDEQAAVKTEEDDAVAAAAAAVAAHAAAATPTTEEGGAKEESAKYPYNPEAAAHHHAAAAAAAAAAYGAAHPGYPYYPPPPGAPAPPHPHHFWGAPPPPYAPGGPPHYPPGAGSGAMKMPGYGDVDGREGATSPSQIETSHRDEVQHMGCTCKKTRCLKLYCQCFGAKIYCGSNCRCLQCHNTPKNEKARKDAIRIIVARNPSAFDTKFKKAVTGAVMPGPVETAVASPDAKILAHKVGCKCRRSACMKKYCECYAANVNCSKNCRCVGCKNMGGAAVAAAAVAAAAAAASYYDGTELKSAYPEGPPPPPFPIPHLHPGQVMQSARDASAASAAKKKSPGTGEQPLQAAQNLAFLKHGASTSPDGKPAAEGGEAKDEGDDSPAEEGVQALMLAAYAMTEFGQGSSPSKSRHDVKREADDGDNEEPAGKRAKV